MRATGFDKSQLISIAEPLVRWFVAHGRALPWRDSPTPYHVWVSEIMLQQTRVEAVKGYYDRFLTRLPDISSLAAAEEELLLKLWEGLGYYNRVRNMQAAARTVMEIYGGTLPLTYEELLKLKGIGTYTAAAIASIAYGQPKAVVDGNVLRVMTRLLANGTDIGNEAFKRALAAALDDTIVTVVTKAQTDAQKSLLYGISNLPGTFNQAMMDLGATVCLPNGSPLCDCCPLREQCKAYKENRVLSYPVKTRLKPRKVEELTVFLICDGDLVSIRKRGSKGLLAGLYELPNAAGHLTEKTALSAVRELGFDVLWVRRLQEAVHVFTHKEWHMIGYEMRIGAGSGVGCGELIMAEPSELRDRYALPSAFLPYLNFLSSD